MTSIVLAADSAYLPYTVCTIARIGEFGSCADGVILLTPAGTSAEALAAPRDTARAHGVDIEVVEVREIEELSARGLMHSRGYVSTFTYSKLLMAELLPDIDDVLYLDVDTLIRASLEPVLSWQLSSPIGAVRELGNNGVPIFGTTHAPYFNAGVLRMSLKRLRDECLAERSLEVLDERPRLAYQDQDVFNLLFHDRHDALPMAFNMFDTYSRHALSSWEMLQDPAVVHFVGPAKPWHSDARSRYAMEWRALHADLSGLTGKEREDYVKSGVASWQEVLHEAVVRARYSRLGVRVRSALPVGLKTSVNDTVLALIPRRTRLSHELGSAIAYRHEGDPAAMGAIVPRDGSDVRTAPSQAGEGARPVSLPMPPPTRHDQVRRTAQDGRLLLVLSAPRSGTNALNSLLEQYLPLARLENEVYGSHMKRPTLSFLAERYPWLKEAPGMTGPDPAHRGERIEAARICRQRMSEVAIEVTDVLLRRNNPAATVIKVFHTQLDLPALRGVLEAFQPRIIVLRRQMLFSFVSQLKANATGKFLRADSSSVDFEISDAMALDYVERADFWFDWVTTTIDELGLHSVDLAYAQLFEDASGEPMLADFLSDWGFRRGGNYAGGFSASTPRQDRRTDESVSRLIAEVGRLRPDTLSELLRLPGTVPR